MDLHIKQVTVTLDGLADIMFDRFIRQEKDTRPAEQKLYLDEGNRIVCPAENLWTFMFGDNPPGCARSFEGKKGREFARIGQAHIVINPALVPFQRDGQDIVFKDFDDTGIAITRFSPRTKMSGGGSIKQDVKERPLLKLPWSLTFQISIVENALVDETRVLNWFQQGGIMIGLGTYRPRFGRFTVR